MYHFEKKFCIGNIRIILNVSNYSSKIRSQIVDNINVMEMWVDDFLYSLG